MAFYDYRQPIEYVVNQYFERKKFYNANYSEDKASSCRGEYPDGSLQEVPCLIIRDEEERATKFIYGEVSRLESADEEEPVIWQEELIRNSDGTVLQIVTTFPDGESATTELVRGLDNKVTEYKYGE